MKMRRRFRKTATGGILLFAILLMMLCSQKTEAASKKYSPYNAILTKPVVDRYGHSHRIDTFALLDIDRDGKKELFVSWFRAIRVYTLQGKKAIPLREFDSGMGVSYNKKDKSIIVFSHGGTGMAEYVLCKVKNRKLKTIRTVKTNGGLVRGKYVQYYYADGKKVSKKKYSAYYNKYFGTKKYSSIFWLNNTAASRNRYLK